MLYLVESVNLGFPWCFPGVFLGCSLVFLGFSLGLPSFPLLVHSSFSKPMLFPLRLPRCPARPAEAGCPDAEASAGDGGAVDGTGQGTQGMPQLGLEGLGDAMRWLRLVAWNDMYTHIYTYIIIEL